MLKRLGHRLPDQLHQDAQLRLLPANQYAFTEDPSKDEADEPECSAFRPCGKRAGYFGILRIEVSVYTAMDERLPCLKLEASSISL